MMGFKLIEESVFSNGYTAIDLTELVESIVVENKLYEGIVTVYSPEPSITILLIEYEPSLLRDLEDFISKHTSRYKHVIDALLGKSVIVPVVDGGLDTGVFKRIVLVDISYKRGSKRVLVGLEGVFRED